MSYIPIPVVTDSLIEPLRHCLKDRDPYVRKTAAICVAKLYTADPRRAEKAGFVEMLRDLMLDGNATVVANAVAALSEIGDRQDGVIFKLNLATANKLLTALGESSEYVITFHLSFLWLIHLEVGANLHLGHLITLCARKACGCRTYGGKNYHSTPARKFCRRLNHD